MFLFLWKGLLLGFSVAAPVGPIGVLCIRRTLQLGPKYGFLTGLGAATADCIYGLIAGFGLASVASSLFEHQHWIRLIGGLFLLYLGWKILFAHPAVINNADVRRGLVAAYGSSFLLTITNPMTILSFAAAFAGLGLGATSESSPSGGFFLVLGVFFGSALWWLILSYGTCKLKHGIKERQMYWVNRLSGTIILGFAVVALSGLFKF